ncbi:MAG TPA: hypothetical protein VNJ51_10440 [Candidatus Dormibacteraeota bacterium]|nr:hypothetical protein [Candidatus Dormibacteraeota bacterium]
MLRWFGVLFVAAALALGACGKIVTLPPGTSPVVGIPSGYMLVRFRTAQPMDFQKYQYLIVFNTSGNGGTPYANAYSTGDFSNFSFALDATGPAPSTASMQLLQYYVIPGGGASSIRVNYPQVPPGIIQFIPNDNGQGNEFSVLFPRALFYLPSPASPSPGPTGGPTPSPSPAPGGLPNPFPTTAAQQTWTVNFFTLNASDSTPVDALGVTGISDTSFTLQLVTTAAFDTQINKPAGADQVPDQAAYISGGEVINAP